MGWRWKAFRLAAIQADYVTSLIDLLMAVLFPLGLYIHLQQRHVSQAPPSLLFPGCRGRNMRHVCALRHFFFFKKFAPKFGCRQNQHGSHHAQFSFFFPAQNGGRSYGNSISSPLGLRSVASSSSPLFPAQNGLY